MDGILLIDKPAGWTSHDVVAKVRSLLRQAQSQKLKAESSTKKLLASNFQPLARGSKIRVGHTGTLDPFATGLLILVIGIYTRRAAEFSKLDKTYEAELTLGAASTTGDPEGTITPSLTLSDFRRSSKKVPKTKEIETVLREFIGKIWQKPHRYSAIKVGGQRVYALARKGKEVQLEPRQVTVHRLQVTDYIYPKLKIVTDVSSGTYIRSLAEDIGRKLDTGAYLSALRRTQVGNFNIKDAHRIDDINLLKHL